jgi:CheY-like chemotaxis protein
MESGSRSPVRILVINDDQSLLETRRILLESYGAKVFTARGTSEAIRETVLEPADLVLIDASNVGLEHGERLCGLVKSLRPGEPVALLVAPERGIPTETQADRVIYRTGPRRILVEIDEMLDGRLGVKLWEGQDDGENSSSRRSS